MMDEEIRQALSEVYEMKKMCGNINTKLTNIVTQRSNVWKARLGAEYQRGLEDGKAQSERGCEGCQYIKRTVFDKPCARCSNAYKSQWTAKQTDDKIEVGDTVNLKDGSRDNDGIVTKSWDNDRHFIMWADGSGGVWDKEYIVKTGRHFDIASILEGMRCGQ